MCGIVGVKRYDGAAVDEGLLREMASRLQHRGPDDEGYWVDSDCGFGHKRLSIIDLAGSHQPMSTADGNFHLTYNGEIFNYQELRRELSRRGYLFRTNGDTEILLALYLIHGLDGYEKLDGQFAFALHDKRQGNLYLYRDRLGILPLYYYEDAKMFAFASEIKALFPALRHVPNVDITSVKEYLAYRSVPPPYTLFEGVRKLDPGKRVTVRPDLPIQIDTWWQIPSEPADQGMDEKQAIQMVSHALEDAVCSRMVSDVPIGAYLSGGLDSSLIVALMAKIREGSVVQTYSAGFDDPRYDELPYALDVSKRLSTEHHEIIIKPDAFGEHWPLLTRHRDAPLSEPADIAIYMLASEARKKVKVLLSGEGSDELFGGYPKYRYAKIVSYCDILPQSLVTFASRRLESLLPVRLARARIMLRAMTAKSEADRFQTWFAPFTQYERDCLLEGDERDRHRDVWNRARGDLIQRMLYVDCHTWLSDNLLERGDRMSMAASVENRPPFLDHNLVELAFKIPSHMKVRRGGVTKWIIKEVARKYLPNSIVDRKKVGFRVPLDVWFKGRLGAMARDTLLSPNSFVGSLLNQSSIEAIINRHQSGRSSEESRIWTLLGLEIWHENCIKS